LAVTIRLKRMGSKKNAFYRIVAADIRASRDGRFIEILGYYDPMKDPPEIKVDDDKVFKWLRNGAEPTENARSILRRIGVMERWELLKSGVEIHQLDSMIEERRAKQPSVGPKKEEEEITETAEEEAASVGEKEDVGEETEDEKAGERKTESKTVEEDVDSSKDEEIKEEESKGEKGGGEKAEPESATGRDEKEQEEGETSTPDNQEESPDKGEEEKK
jgi:small subunit ribosomal protein S16